jgi:hypothetical protein
MRVANPIYVTCLALAAAFSASMINAQDAQPASSLVGMRECENGICGNWTFGEDLGTGHYDNGAVATLTYKIEKRAKGEGKDRFIETIVTIKREDFSGKLKGLKVTYTGTSDSNGLHGTFLSSDPKHKSGDWIASPAEPELEPPNEFHFCGLHCSTLRRDNGFSDDQPHYGTTSSVWIVEKFTPDSVVIDRTEYNQNHEKVLHMTLTGSLSSKGDEIVNGKSVWDYAAWEPHSGTGCFSAAWGDDEEKVPGSDAEMNARNYPNCQTGATPPPPIKVRDVTEALDLMTALVKLWNATHPTN